jgi:magnesium transporter
MNDIIKMLTLISTVFMPLSFVAGVYGMNFNTEHPFNMPELDFAYGYPLVLLFMVCIAGVMLWFFKKRNWL